MFYMRRRQNYPQKNDFKVKHVPSPIKGLLLLPSPNCKAGCRKRHQIGRWDNIDNWNATTTKLELLRNKWSLREVLSLNEKDYQRLQLENWTIKVHTAILPGSKIPKRHNKNKIDNISLSILENFQMKMPYSQSAIYQPCRM